MDAIGVASPPPLFGFVKGFSRLLLLLLLDNFADFDGKALRFDLTLVPLPAVLTLADVVDCS